VTNRGEAALHGASILTGIGFTMSLFIATLALGESEYEAAMRLGVLLDSALSATVGATVLGFTARGGEAAPQARSRPVFGK
jgi:NhaA family Na+:H+ antiporter